MTLLEPIIQMQGICKSYQMGVSVLPVLKDVNLKILPGEFVAVLGPSGSGKSTLMNIIGCIDVADSGSYLLGGESIEAREEDQLAEVRNRRIGFVFQRFNLLPKYTAEHNVAFPLLLRGMSREEAFPAARGALREVGLEDRFGHKPNELSGGQQQRVSIARALVGQPDILLADEPTGSLDSGTGQEVLRLFRRLHQAHHTIILITHDQEVAAHAQRVIHVRDGILS